VCFEGAKEPGYLSNVKSFKNNENVIYYNLDSLSKELEETKERRLASIGRVSEIIAEGLSEFSLWLDEAPLRDLLGEYKILIDQKVKDSFESNTDISDMKMISNQVMRTLIKNPEVLTHSEKADSLITEQIAVLSTQYS
jgi:glutamyl-tRNA reductase